MSVDYSSFGLMGKIAVVTGASQGIGRAIAVGLAKAGTDVVLAKYPDSRQDEIESVRREVEAVGRRAIIVPTDVSKVADLNAMIDRATDEFGRVDILVNNAGIAGPTAPLWEYPLEELQATMRVNLDGPFNCCHALVPGMIAQNYGRIVNIASIAGKEGNPNASAYSASKAALIGLTKSLGKELATYDIAVNAITPAVARTAILGQTTQAHIDYMVSKIPRGRTVEVHELAALVAWAASEDCSFTTGSVLDASGGRATY